MRAAINCALANRQILTHLVREVFADLLPRPRLPLLYDVSHNTCKVESTCRRRRARALRAPQGRDARLRPGPSGLPGPARGRASRC
jgi:tRNA-splicing ligase RtcB (3'-phosphate/5'-hydroxy nucleic acid ligase)